MVVDGKELVAAPSHCVLHGAVEPTLSSSRVNFSVRLTETVITVRVLSALFMSRNHLIASFLPYDKICYLSDLFPTRKSGAQS